MLLLSPWENDNNNYNINTTLFIEIWCNGSTIDFGSISSGSNPDISTNITIVSSVYCYLILVIMFVEKPDLNITCPALFLSIYLPKMIANLTYNQFSI